MKARPNRPTLSIFIFDSENSSMMRYVLLQFQDLGYNKDKIPRFLKMEDSFETLKYFQKIVIYTVNLMISYEQYINSIFRDDIDSMDTFIYTLILRKNL